MADPCEKISHQEGSKSTIKSKMKFSGEIYFLVVPKMCNQIYHRADSIKIHIISGANVINKCYSRLRSYAGEAEMMHFDWFKNSRVTWNSQSECFISCLSCSCATLKFVYDIGYMLWFTQFFGLWTAFYVQSVWPEKNRTNVHKSCPKMI